MSNTQPSMFLDFIQDPFDGMAGSTPGEFLCYPPTPFQFKDHDALSLSPESFDQEFDGDEEVGTYVPSEQVAAAIRSRSNDTTNPVVPTPTTLPASAFTYSNVSSYGNYPSHYSFNVTSSESGYFNPSELEGNGSVNNWHQTMPQSSIPSAEFTALSNIPPFSPAEANGTTDIKPNFQADYSTVMQQLEAVTCTCVDPAALSVHVTADDKSDKAQQPEKPFKCPHCQFASARKHNLKTHVATHDKEASKRFECSICSRRFSRKHDLHRHRETIHGNLRASRRRSGQQPEQDAGQYNHTTTSSTGDGQSTSSLYPGAPGLMARWENSTWLNGPP